MAFPVIASTSTAGPTADATSHSVSLPSGVSSGDLLIALISNDSTSDTSITGWTELYNTNTPLDNASAWYRVADGSEGASVSVSVATSQSISIIILRITGIDSATPLEMSATATGVSSNPDSSSLSPSWGAADTLWLSVFHTQVGMSIISNPVNYTAGLAVSGTSSAEASVAYAYRELNASSEDPGAFTINTNRSWVAYTFAIKPSAASVAKGGIVITQQLEMLGGGVL